MNVTSEAPGTDAGRIEEFRSEFPLLQNTTYMNSCSLGALSTRSERYLAEYLELWNTMGAAAWYDHWFGRLTLLRERVARFLGASTSELALMPSTSAALSSVSESVTYGERNRVVCTELDFPTVPYQWRVKPEVELVVLPSHDGARVDLEQFAEAVDERTMFIATSHVFFLTGYIQDIRTLAEIAHGAGAYCFIDGYHGPGQIPVDVRAAGVDFYTSGPLKWLLGGPGLAYLYAREELIQDLHPRITSWLAAASPFDFDPERFEPRSDAGRFEGGTPAIPTIYTALGGQEIIEEFGIEAIQARNRELLTYLVERVQGLGLELTIPTDPSERAGIGMVKHPDPAAAVAHLVGKGVIVDHRPGHIRASPHFYNTLEEVDRFVEVLAEVTPES